ncbi:fucose mutarotase-like [Halichondria panicea]|uniref:fucose mutarotase-like n=1 Tax=Halichondria panicea TaxID=6063 RepID=UPI00312BA1D0
MVVLKTIPRILSPELLTVLARMGHGDEIVLADANFPSASVSKCGPELIRADGHGIPSLLKGVMQLLPLDTYTAAPVLLMDLVPSDKMKALKTPVWDEYKKIINQAEGKIIEIELLERFAFYERAKNAFAVVATGEGALYGNIILKKGVLAPEAKEN